MNLTLYIDAQRKELFTSLTDSTLVPVPALYQGDTLAAQINFATRVPALAAKSFAGAAVTIYLSTATGTQLANGTLAEVGGGAGAQFAGTLALNTAAITTHLAGSAEADAILSVVITGNDGTRETALQAPVKLHADLTGTASAATLPGVTYFTAAEAAALFARVLGNAGQSLTLVSANGNRRRIIGVDNDGNPTDDIV
jgi:hypothetical protein